MLRLPVLTFTLLFLAAPAFGQLANPGFENKTKGWEVTVYGAKPDVEFDDAERHEGKWSLRISATDNSDTALGQEITLKPGRCYRLLGWVRTRGLDPTNASVFGTFQVQNAGGSGTIVSGKNHKGDTDWTEESLSFMTPADGKVRICAFFVGFGRGTGTAWFDDLRLEEVDLSRVPLKITKDSLTDGVINPMQYGQFIEYLCNLVPGMWAEKLYDGGFEGLSPYNFYYLKETDFREKPWYPYGATNRAEFVRDAVKPVGGKLAQKIAVQGAAPCTVGTAQDGIAVQTEVPCTFSGYFRQTGIKGKVRVTLLREGKPIASSEFEPGADWKKYSAKLKLDDRAKHFGRGWDDTNHATLAITFQGPGTLWLDNLSLMPDNNVKGWRPDVVEALRELKPGVIRFGGSALDEPGYGGFEWKDTIGDPDHRKPLRAWGGLQPTGPGLEEIVQLCKEVGAEPLICVRVSGRSPKDAAEQIEYFNGAGDTPMGKLRVQNGHKEPYKIRYWQIGNERSGKQYEDELAAYAKAMKAADPSIKLLSSYPTPGVLKNGADTLEYVCPHHYAIANLANTEQDIVNIRKMIEEFAPKSSIKIAVTEWNTTAGDIGPRRAMLWTLENALACSRYHNVMHRHCDIVEIANRSNLTNSFCSGIIQTDNHRLYKTPTYYAQQLYATRAGNKALKVVSTFPANSLPDVSATLSAKGDAVVLFAVNPTLQPVTRPLDFSAFGDGQKEIEVWTLSDRDKAAEPDVTNSFGDPERIKVQASKQMVAANTFDYAFPPLSLTVLQLNIKR
jgi:alpha-N-arabinofuranosidase